MMLFSYFLCASGFRSFFVFSSACSARPRALHSFPTRRSSDLGAGAAEGAVDAANLLKPMLARGELRAVGATTKLATGQHRSEEHTSELQSPYDLVCRLLLEKKKTQKITS